MDGAPVAWAQVDELLTGDVGADSTHVQREAFRADNWQKEV